MPMGTARKNQSCHVGFHENHTNPYVRVLIITFRFSRPATARLVWVGMPKVIMPPTDCCPDRPMEADSMMSVRPRPPLSH